MASTGVRKELMGDPNFTSRMFDQGIERIDHFRRVVAVHNFDIDFVELSIHVLPPNVYLSNSHAID
ncbi:hypothetical protein D3C80_1488520 [compost metagenome]